MTIARNVVQLKNNLVAGKAFDDRAAVVCVVEALNDLATMKHTWDVYAVANVQEEVGFLGAITSTLQINPDVAIAIDVGHADQPNVPEVEPLPLERWDGHCAGSEHSSAGARQVDPVARANEIPFKVTAYAGDRPAQMRGRCKWCAKASRQGLIDIPLRYMHTSVETLCINDLERIGRLLARSAHHSMTNLCTNCAAKRKRLKKNLRRKKSNGNTKTQTIKCDGRPMTDDGCITFGHRSSVLRLRSMF